MTASPTAPRAPHDPSRHLDAWRHVFAHLDANPLQLLRIGRTCTTFAYLAADNAHWLPHSPADALGLAPSPPHLPPPKPVHGWGLDGAQGCNWGAEGATFPDYDDAVAYRAQLWAVQEGQQPHLACLPELPTTLRGEASHGVLQRAFQQRMARYVTLAGSGDVHAKNVVHLLPRLWSADSVGCARSAVLFDPFAQTPPPGPDFDLDGMLVHGRQDYDLWRALMDRPELDVRLSDAGLALQAEPTLCAPYVARERGYGGLRAPAVTTDLKLFWQLATTDRFALGSVHRSLRERLDVAVWALKHFDAGLAEVDGRMRQNVCYPALVAEVPEDSPIWRQPGDAALMRSITSWEALTALAYAAG